MTDVVELGGPRTTLPDEVIEEILTRLPFVARCRFRCVCSKWKSHLSCGSSSLPFIHPMPSCTVWSSYQNLDAMFFCHAESHWFNVPHVALPSSRRKWVVEDVEEGFVCYVRDDSVPGQYDADFSIAISNPLMGSFQILPKVDSIECRYETITKLWVDQENSTFKVIVLVNIPAVTEVFDSCTSQWDTFDSHDDIINFELGWVQFFFWKNVPYIHCFYEGDLDDPSYPAWCQDEEPRIFSLDVEYREWTSINVKFPGRKCFPMQYMIIVREEEIMLVQICPLAGSKFLSVWKFLDDTDADADGSDSKLSFSRWEKIIVVPSEPTPKFEIHGCRQIYCGDEYIFFVLNRNEVPENVEGPVYAKYTFATKTWSLTPIPNRTRWIGSRNSTHYRSFQWKPSLDKEVKLQGQES